MKEKQPKHQQLQCNTSPRNCQRQSPPLRNPNPTIQSRRRQRSVKLRIKRLEHYRPTPIFATRPAKAAHFYVGRLYPTSCFQSLNDTHYGLHKNFVIASVNRVLATYCRNRHRPFGTASSLVWKWNDVPWAMVRHCGNCTGHRRFYNRPRIPILYYSNKEER